MSKTQGGTFVPNMLTPNQIDSAVIALTNVSQIVKVTPGGVVRIYTTSATLSLSINFGRDRTVTAAATDMNISAAGSAGVPYEGIFFQVPNNCEWMAIISNSAGPYNVGITMGA